MKRISPPTRAFRRVLTVFVAIAGVGAFALPRAEAADNSLVTSTPAANSTVETSPPSLVLTFANALGATNTVEVVCNGSPVAVGTPQVGIDGVSLTVSVPNPLPKGECVVSWLVSQPDGVGGGSSTFAFTVANDTAATLAPPATTTPTGSIPLGGPWVCRDC
jgi:methionine-rich copper-binding protein CopC